MSNLRRLLFLTVLSFLPLSSPLLRAQTYNWNLGTDGAWDTTSPNWTGAGTVWVNSNTSDAVFGGTPVLVTANQSITANSISFNASGYTIRTTNGSVLTLAGDAELAANFSAGASVSINIGFGGTDGLTKTGTGKVVLNTASSYSGATTISEGAIQIASGNDRLPTGTDLSIASGASLIIESGRSQQVATLTGLGTVSGSGAAAASFTVGGNLAGTDHTGSILNGGSGGLEVIKTGTGTQTFGGVATSNYSNGTSINGGTLVAAKNSAFGTGAAAVASGATWGLTSGIVQSNTATIAGSGASGRAGAIDNISGNNTLSGAITLSGNATIGTTGGSLNLSGGVDLGSFTGTFSTNGSAPISVSNAISGSGNLVKNGAGTVTLTGTNTYGGSTTVNAGALIVDGATAGSGTNVGNGGTLGGTGSVGNAVNVFNGGTLRAAQSNDLSVTSLFLDGGSHLALTLGAPNTGAASVTVGTDLTLGGVLDITDGGGFDYGIYRLIDYGGSLTDGGLTIGSVPTGFNPGGMTIDTSTAGVVNLIVSAAVTEQYWDGPNTTPSLVPGGSGGSGVWNTTSTNWTNSAGNVNGAWASQDAVFGGSAGTVTVGAAITSGTVLMQTDNYLFTSSAGNSITFNAWRGGLTATFSGDLGLFASASNAIVDGTMILQDNVVLTAQVNQALPGGTIQLQGESMVTQNDVEGIAGGNFTFSDAQGGTGGTLKLNGFDAVVNSLASAGGAGLVQNAGASDVTLKVNQATDTTFDGTITNGGSGGILYFNKQGAGTLTLTGTMNSTGTITVDGGILEVGAGGDVNIGTAGIAVGSAGSGTFRVSGGGKVTSRDVDLGIGDAGNAVITGAGSQWDANFFSVGRITSGDLQILDGGVLNASRTYVGSVSSGLATVSGAGSELNSSAGILIAFDTGGSGTLTVSDGGKVTTNQIEIGNGGGTGGIVIEGAAGNRGLVETARIIRQGGTATIDVNGGLLRATANETNFLQNFGSGDVTLGAGGLFLDTNGFDVGITAVLDGTGGLTKQGSGALTLSGANSYGGGTALQTGRINIGNNSALGSGTLTVSEGTTLATDGSARAIANNIVVNGNFSIYPQGTLVGFSSFTLNGDIDLTGGDRTITNPSDFSGGDFGEVNFGGAISNGGLTLNTLPGSYAFFHMSGAASNTYTGNTDLQTGISLQLDKTGGATSIAGDLSIQNDAVAVVQRSEQIADSSTVTINGIGRLQVGANFDVTETIGTLMGNGEVTLNDDSTGSKLRVSSGTFSGVIDGGVAGGTSLEKTGTGVLTLGGTNTYLGNTEVQGGELRMNGSLAGGTVTVASGATLSGTGSIAGSVTIEDGATLAAGASPGTLTVGALTLNSTSILDFELDTAGVAGGGVNDLIVVNGDLTLDGILNVTNLGGMSNGVYRLFDYTGALTDNGLTFGTMASGFSYAIDTATANQINLLVGGDGLQFWNDGVTTPNGTVNGGAGNWSAAATNWTDSTGTVAGAWGSNTAVFAGTAGGTVTVVDDVSFQKLQFMTDGYEIVSDGTHGLTVTGAAEVQVDSGITAEMSVAIGGSGSLDKKGAGTLILSGANTHNGGTVLTGGTLRVGSDDALGTGDLVINGGVLGNSGNSPFLANNVTVGANFGLDVQGSAELLELAGIIDLGSASRTITLTGDGEVCFSGNFTGSGGLNLQTSESSYTVTMCGPDSNTHTGLTTVGANVQLGLQKDPGALAIQGDLLVEADGAVALEGDDQINSASTVTVNGTFDMFLAQQQTIGDLQGSSTGTVGGGVLGSTLTVLSGLFDGAMTDGSGQLNLTKDGSGTFVLNGNNSYTGVTKIDAGTLQIGNGGTTGNLVAGAVTNNGILAFNRSDTITVDNVISGSGRLTQAGSGTTILTGTNTYAGGTSITGGILQIGNGGTEGSITGNVTAAAGTALAFNHSDDVTFAGAMTGNGALIKNGDGKLTITGANMYFGGTQVNSGIFEIADGSTIYGQIVNNSQVVINRSDNVDPASTAISGTGSVIKRGVGNLIVSTTNTYTGGTTIEQGGIQLGNGGTTGSVTGNIVNNGALSIFRSDDTVLDNLISGTGTFTKLGTNKVVMTAANTYTGLTSVNAGTLVNNGSLAGDVLVAQGATFGGSGTIAGNLTMNGNLSPGNSPGIVNIGGNLVLGANSVTTIEVAGLSAGQFDQINVAGDASINGAFVLQILPGYSPQIGDTINFLNVGGTLSGQFSSMTTNLNGSLQPVLIYGPGGVIVQIVFGQGQFMPFARTPNQRSVAANLDRFTSLEQSQNSALFNLLNSLPGTALPNAFDQISPDEYGSMSRPILSYNATQQSNLQRRFADVRAGATGFSANGFTLLGFDRSLLLAGGGDAMAKQILSDPDKSPMRLAKDNKWGFFVNGSGQFGDLETDGNGKGYDFTTGGVSVGMDYRVSESVVIGGSLGYANSSTDTDGNGGRIQANNAKALLYASWFDRGFYANGAVGGGGTSYDTKRNVLGSRVTGDTDGGDFTTFVGGGYDFKAGNLTIGPAASLEYSYVNVSGFTEQGGLAPLQIQDQDFDSLRSRLGILASYLFEFGDVRVIPTLNAAWQHEFMDTAQTVSARFANGAGGVFGVQSAAVGRDSAIVGLGLNVEWSRSWSTYLAYDAEAADRFLVQSINGGVKFKF